MSESTEYEGRRITTKQTQILIAEDSPTQAQKLTWLLEDADYEVRLARHGIEALDMMQQKLPDLLITDVVMPEMDGYQLCEAVRKIFGMDVPVMLVTSLKSSKDVLKGLKVGADNFLTKPYQGDHLLDQVGYLMSNRKLRGRRKMEVGIEIEFAGERHFITADRQQILDLLISTYHEAVHLNQELALNTDKLKATIKLQNTQLHLANALQKCSSVADILSAACELLLPLKQVDSIWFSVKDSTGNWQVNAGQMPKFISQDTFQLACQCLQGFGRDKNTFQPHRCELSQSIDDLLWHLCVPIDIDGKPSYALNLLFIKKYGIFEDVSDSIKLTANLIETNLQRVMLLNELEERVERRTEALAQSEQRFRAIVDSELFGAVMLSAEGKITYQNSTAQALLQYQPEQEVLLQTMLDSEQGTPIFNLPLDKRLLQRPYAFRLRRADGETVPVLLRFSHLDDENKSLLCAFIDMSDLKQAEEKLASMQRLDSIASLSGGIAHDFNNLLSVILGNTDILLDKSVSETDREKASITIQKAAQSGADLTRQLLAFARCQPLASETVDVKQVVIGLKQFIDRVISKDIQLEVNYEAETWPILTDYSQLERVLLNLAINAQDAMPHGGSLTINTVNCTDVDTTETLSHELIQGEFVRIEIRDSGLGIPSNILAKVFEPFFTTKKAGKGTGLGLAMVYGFVKQCKGFLQVESRPGETCFILYFPPYRESQKIRLDGVEKPLPHGNNQLLLVVEDNKDLRAIMVRHIHSLGYRCIEAENAEVAQEIILQQGKELSLVLTDFKLPGRQSGLDLISNIALSWPDLPVALITGSTIDVERKTRDALSQFSILKKPFRRHQLAKLIDKMLIKDDRKKR